MMVENKKMKSLTQGSKIFLDMDGVLARFEQEPNALERFEKEKDFFEKLAPTKLTLKLKDVELKDTYILTSSPHAEADNSKRKWIKKYLPQLADKVITVRSGKEKSNYAKGNILVDDFTENLEYWNSKGGTGVKALNGINGLTLRYKEVTAMEIRVD